MRSNPINLYTQPVTKQQGYSFTIKPSDSKQKTIPVVRDSPIKVDRTQQINSQCIVFDRQDSESEINKSMTSIKALRNDTKAREDTLS